MTEHGGTSLGNSPDAGRNASIEGLRIIAAFGIVWFHEKAPWQDVGYAGLPIFLLIFFYYAEANAPRIGAAENARRVADRLLRPWIAWTLIYSALDMAECLLYDRKLNINLTVWTILVGAKIHLWYLPFTAASAIVLRTIWIASRRPNSPIASFVAFSIALLVAGYAAGLPSFTVTPLAQYLFAVPAVPLASYLIAIHKLGSLKSRLLTLGSCLWVPATVWVADHLSGFNYFCPYAIGFSACAVAMAFPIKLTQATTAAVNRISRLMLGVYLLHPLVSALLSRTVHISDPVTSVILIFSLSGIGSEILRRSLVGRFIL